MKLLGRSYANIKEVTGDVVGGVPFLEFELKWLENTVEI